MTISSAPTRAGFVGAYEKTPPWDIGRCQRDLLQAFDELQLSGNLLDIGCGTGEHVLELARRGVDAWGMDSTASALELARRKAAERSIEGATFIEGDALHLSTLGEKFQTTLDCGLWHVIADGERQRYIDEVTRIVVPGGQHLMLGFDTNTTGFGPRGYSLEELRQGWSARWREVFVREATYEVNSGPGPDGKPAPRRPDGRPGLKSWLSLYQKIDSSTTGPR